MPVGAHGRYVVVSLLFLCVIFGFKLKLPSAINVDKSKIFLIKYDSDNNLLFKLSRLSLYIL